MFSAICPRPYYYGDGTDHIIYLTEEQANAVNKLIIFEFDIETGYCRVNLDDEELKHYDAAARIMNDYLDRHPGEVTLEDPDSPILRIAA